MRQLMETLDLKRQFRPFTLCLECNQPLVERSREEVKDRVPPYVYKTQNQYMECPACHRIYWRGTHWETMVKKLKDIQRYFRYSLHGRWGHRRIRNENSKSL